MLHEDDTKTQVAKSEQRCPLRRAPQRPRAQNPTAAFVCHRPIWASNGKDLANLTALASYRTSTRRQRRRYPTPTLVCHNRHIWSTIGKGVTDGTTVASRSPRTRAIRPKTTRMSVSECQAEAQNVVTREVNVAINRRDAEVLAQFNTEVESAVVREKAPLLAEL